jgi:hypothetical protein
MPISRDNNKTNKIMATRIFRFETNGEGSNEMMFLEDSEIEHRYNPYGAYQKLESENFEELIAEYRKERYEAFADFSEENENYTLADVKEFITDFNEDYEYWPDGYSRGTGRPRILQECTDEDWASNSIGYYDEDGNKAELEAIEVYEYWNGSNFKEVILDSTYNSLVEECTDEYCPVEEMVKFGDWKGNTSGGHFLWDAENEKIIAYEWSAYQGTEPTWTDVAVMDIIRIIEETPEIERLVELINEELGGYDLKKGEKLYLDEGLVTYEYRGEQYHYSHDEITEKYGDYCVNFSTTIDLDIARNAIRKRRLEAIKNVFSKNNYEKVMQLPLNKIWVSYENSIDAGNCKPLTTSTMISIMENEGISSKVFAFRADALLEYRNDNYVKRAILNAYQSRLRQA